MHQHLWSCPSTDRAPWPMAPPRFEFLNARKLRLCLT